MKTIRNHQLQARDSIIKAINEKNKRFLVSMPAGVGRMTIVLETCLRLIQSNSKSSFLFLVNHQEIKQQLSYCIYSEYEYLNTTNSIVDILTYQQIRSWKEVKADYVFCIDAHQMPAIQLSASQQTVFVGITDRPLPQKTSFFTGAPTVFSYSLQEAVHDAVILPSEAFHMHEEAILGFCDRLFNHLNIKVIENDQKINRQVDLVVQSDNQKILVECKSYRSSNVAPDQLQHVVMRMASYVKDVQAKGLIIVFSNLSSHLIELFYDQHQITIWDVSNIVYLCHNNKELLDQLKTLTFFPLSTISPSKPYGWIPHFIEQPIVSINDTLEKRAQELINNLKKCKEGKNYSREYENICANIVKYLFENQFSRIETQNTTVDSMFRMDMICAIKEAGSFLGLDKTLLSFSLYCL